MRAQLKVLHPGRLPGITPVGNHRGSRSSLNTYEVSEYDELSPRSAQHSCCREKLSGKDSARQERIPMQDGRCHWKSPQYGPANVPRAVLNPL